MWRGEREDALAIWIKNFLVKKKDNISSMGPRCGIGGLG